MSLSDITSSDDESYHSDSSGDDHVMLACAARSKAKKRVSLKKLKPKLAKKVKAAGRASLIKHRQGVEDEYVRLYHKHCELEIAFGIPEDQRFSRFSKYKGEARLSPKERLLMQVGTAALKNKAAKDAEKKAAGDSAKMAAPPALTPTNGPCAMDGPATCAQMTAPAAGTFWPIPENVALPVAAFLGELDFDN